MNKFVRRGQRPGVPFRAVAMHVGALLLTAATGCRPVANRFEIAAFRDPARPTHFVEQFAEGGYSVDAQRNWNFVFEMDPAYDAASQSNAPRSDVAMRNDDAGRPAMEQIVHVRVFWRPRPGTTFVESTQTNAAITYCLRRGDDVITYEGAGFVYFSEGSGGRGLRGRLESSALAPTRRVGQPEDLFGRCQLSGTFVAREDRARVVSILQRLRRELGAASPPSPAPITSIIP